MAADDITGLSPNTYIPSFGEGIDAPPDHFIVCGLGSLGQQTIVNLKKFSSEPFEVNIAAIDKFPPQDWEVDHLSELLIQAPIVGDCRRDTVLKQAGISDCRAILVVTSDESINIETAIAVRRLNPRVQIIVRSSRIGLNQLLADQLGRFVALDATELPAMTFALAGLGDETLSVFTVGPYQFRVTERFVPVGDPQYDNFPIHRLHRSGSRLLNLKPSQRPHQPIGWATTASSVFHRWQPHVRVRAGDQIAYVEVESLEDNTAQKQQRKVPLFSKLRAELEDFFEGEWLRRLFSFWQQDDQQSLLRVTAIAIVISILLGGSGTLLLKLNVTDLSWLQAISLGAILLLGGYGDVFGGFDPPKAPGWVLIACLLIALSSLIMVLGVFGLLADQLLSSRFEFLRHRPRLPKRDHVIVVGLGRVGRRVVRILQDLKQPMVVISHQQQPLDLRSQVPVLQGNILQELPAANLKTARSVIAVTDDPMLNLEISLIASQTVKHRRSSFSPVVRTLTQTFSDNLVALLPQAKSFSAYALSAEAFAGAAFGENILGLFRLNQQTILITEYTVESGDTLIDKSLAEISYGYGVVPVLLQTRDQQDILMPLDDTRVQNGDRLYVLSSINGLRRIEHGDRTPPRTWQLEAERPLNTEVLLEAGNTLAKLSGLELAQCRQFMAQLPNRMSLTLYDYQAHRLLQELNRRLPTRLKPV